MFNCHISLYEILTEKNTHNSKFFWNKVLSKMNDLFDPEYISRKYARDKYNNGSHSTND